VTIQDPILLSGLLRLISLLFYLKMLHVGHSLYYLHNLLVNINDKLYKLNISYVSFVWCSFQALGSTSSAARSTAEKKS
jgi:hypothetical protein